MGLAGPLHGIVARFIFSFKGPNEPLLAVKCKESAYVGSLWADIIKKSAKYLKEATKEFINSLAFWDNFRLQLFFRLILLNMHLGPEIINTLLWSKNIFFSFFGVEAKLQPFCSSRKA